MRFFARTPAAAASQAGEAPTVLPPLLTRHDLDPRLAGVARPARAVTPDTRLGYLIEVLRMSPYRAVPVVDAQEAPDPFAAGPRLVGLVREEDVLQALLRASDAAERARVRETPARALITPPSVLVTTGMRVSEAAALFEAAPGTDVLPVVDAFGTYLGLVARSDLVQDLVRPFRPPLVGGMATPLGVYLTTGTVSGGAGTFALVLSGLVLFCLQLVGQGVGQGLAEAGHQALITLVGPAAVGALPLSLKTTLTALVPLVAQFALFLLLLRLSPIAGYHAAEHQVVHAIERAEPLVVETVRAMPRVHPRCGTNLVAGMMIVTLGGSALLPFLGALGGDWGAAGFVLSAVAALAYWRSLGAWLQQHFTTRPATDAQIESGIRAARQLLHAHGHYGLLAAGGMFAPRPRRGAGYGLLRPRPPLLRLWRMGFVQILGGFAIGYGLLEVAALLSPGLRAILGSLMLR